MFKKNIIFVMLLIVFMCNKARADESDASIHDELRGILKQVETAINTGRYDDMLPVLSENLRATPINQEFLTNRKEVSVYFNKWFGKEGYLKKLEIKFTPDVVTELSEDKTWGLVYGTGIENYILSDSRKYELHTRWTALAVKESDGKWRIRSIHIGTNFLDNPILSMVEDNAKYFAIGGIVVGLILGLGLSWLMRRRK
jgi:hypothetical protein